MKICAIICEYNPFHNGHLYQISEAKRLSSADAVLCLMSGNFVQRGDAAIINKYTRARHAVQAGADIVVELPTVFATSNAELFAKGSIHLLSSIPAVSVLCFGCESAEKDAFLKAAKLLNNEPNEVSEKIKIATANGTSYVKARADAWAEKIPYDMLSSPNNILGLEYTKAILLNNADIDILPIARIGANYNDAQLKNNYSSASAIRAAIANKTDFGNNLPDFAAKDLPSQLQNCLDVLEKYAILSCVPEKIAAVCDCKEGLEHAFKKAATQSLPLVKALTSPRYTSARINRIALQNLLGIEERFIRACLSNPLYYSVLSANKARSDVLSALGEAKFPLIIRAHDENALSDIAKECFEKDLFASAVHNLLYTYFALKNIFI